jgi:hypothetical protein
MSAGAAGAAAAAIAQAIKASGVIIHVEPDDFVGILRRQPGALVVQATGGFFSTSYRYLTSYKWLAFFCARLSLRLGDRHRCRHGLRCSGGAVILDDLERDL